jgi:hypothetical protein
LKSIETTANPRNPVRFTKMNPRLNKRKSLSEKKLIIPNPTKKKRKQNVKSEKKTNIKKRPFCALH